MRAALVPVLVRVVLGGVLLVAVVVGPAPPASADAGPWGWPLTGAQEVARPFAPPAGRYGAGHRGADLPGSPGAPVRASAQGRVTYAGLIAGRGVVVVSHGSLRTTYEPVTAVVAVGRSVALGEVVGRLEAGHLGCPAAACLHWGLRRGEEYLDPVRLVQRAPVRLLPLEPATPLINAETPHAGARQEASKRGADQPPAEAEAEAGAGAAEAASPVLPAEPSWSLRAAEAPLGAAALAALVVGIGLLARPRPLPPGPTSGGIAAPAAPVRDEPVLPSAETLALDDARARRRAAS